MNNNYDTLIFELSEEQKQGYRLPPNDVEASFEIPANLKRSENLQLPQVSEPEIVRHYTCLSQKNYGLDSGFYPLGSCTMKYNPKINEDMATLPGLCNLHPYQPEETVQGAMELMYGLERFLSEITGMSKFTLQPAAGAHGELAGLMVFKAYHESNGDSKRKNIIVPDSSHGTNPASAMAAGFNVIQITSREDGTVDLDALAEALDDETAGLMLTNPNTLGIFETNITKIADMVHDNGGLLYYDGANMNAIMGIAKPGDMGFDVIHLNVHKTFSTPHGGGGPGAGPVGVAEHLAEFLPTPIIKENEGGFYFDDEGKNSIGKLRGFYGSFGVLIKAYCYIKTMGADGLKSASQMAVLNANYMKEKLKTRYKLPYDRTCMHEFVLDGLDGETNGVETLDVAKRLIDLGYHPPTIYFPLIVDSAIMVEPTETESLETLNAFIDAMIQIADEAKENPSIAKEAPTLTPVRRLDEVKAAKNPVLKWTSDL